MAVIQHHAAPIDVKLAVNVARNACATRCLNIDLRSAIGAIGDLRLLAAGRMVIDDNRCLSRGETGKREQKPKGQRRGMDVSVDPVRASAPDCGDTPAR